MWLVPPPLYMSYRLLTKNLGFNHVCMCACGYFVTSLLRPCNLARFKDMQAKGFEAGSTTGGIPTAEAIVALGRALMWPE